MVLCLGRAHCKKVEDTLKDKRIDNYSEWSYPTVCSLVLSEGEDKTSNSCCKTESIDDPVHFDQPNDEIVKNLLFFSDNCFRK